MFSAGLLNFCSFLKTFSGHIFSRDSWFMQVVRLSNVGKVLSVAMLESAFSHVLYKAKAHTLANVMMVILESFVRQVIINKTTSVGAQNQS